MTAFLPREPRRSAAGTAGRFAMAAAGPLAGGTVLFSSDALGGVVRVPGDVVTYMALTGLVLACAALVPALWLAGRLRPHRSAALGGALAGTGVALAGLVPAVPVFASALMAAGILAAPLLAAPRASALRTAGSPAGGQAAALAGLAAAAWIATLWSAHPGKALLVAGATAAVLAVVAAGPHGPPAEPGRPVARVRDVLAVRDVRAALPAYLLAGWAAGAPLMGGLHLLTFRWNLIGAEPVRYLAWALLPAVALVVAGRRATGAARTGPWLLLAGAAAPMLMASAPGPVLLAAGFTIALAAACLTAAALDTAVLRPLPDSRRLAAAGLTGVAAAAGGLAGLGCAAVLRGILAEGSALTLTALPPILGALLALRVHGPQAERPPAFLAVRALSVPRGAVRLHRVAMRVEAGETVVLSGSGASVLLAALAGRTPCRGGISLGGADLTALDAAQRTSLGLCHLAGPEPRAPGGRPVAAGLGAHARALGHADPEAAVRSVLDVFPQLRGLAGAPAGTLTAAQRGLLSLAEALLTRPRLLLVDGLAGGPCAAAVPPVLRRLAATGTAVVIAGPAAPETLALARRAYTVEPGGVTEVPVPASGGAHRPPAVRSTGGPAL
ncbi:ATP-binding cassette domain-containing protein [Actinomadura sp. NPDC023710]|uniref:ATP-binding cassette domain-containing protein n=1 Tax=Actinomadura sp. NPDC023710 TaxID=3158219 RepID=UPI0033F7911E